MFRFARSVLDPVGADMDAAKLDGGPAAAYRAAIVRRAARPCMIEGSEDVCRQLQNGEAPSGMGAVLSIN